LNRFPLDDAREVGSKNTPPMVTKILQVEFHPYFDFILFFWILRRHIPAEICVGESCDSFFDGRVLFLNLNNDDSAFSVLGGKKF
jgi:hypothetical protein